MGRNVWTRHAQRARLAAATLALQHVVTHQGLHGLHGFLLLHGAVAGVVVQISTTRVQLHAFFEQELVDIDDAAAGENLVEFIALQLVVASTAAHHHGLDVQIVERVGHTMEQHPVVGDDFLGLVELARAFLRVTAAQVARRQHGLYRISYITPWSAKLRFKIMGNFPRYFWWY